MDRYILDSKIGEGSYGIVYKIINGKNKYALKIEKEKSTLKNEINVLLSLVHPHIPPLLDYGISNHCTYIVIPLFHTSLYQISQHSPEFFTCVAVSNIGVCILRVLEYIHGQGYIYRDLKPENMMVGYDKKIHLIDFGMSVRYSYDGQHIREGMKRIFVGTMRYASVNTHKGYVQSRRDDLESLGYVLLFLLRGRVPWSDDEREDRQRIGQMKADISNESLCESLNGSTHWVKYFHYVKSLRFSETPDYRYLERCLGQTAVKNTEALVSVPGDDFERSRIVRFLRRLFCC